MWKIATRLRMDGGGQAQLLNEIAFVRRSLTFIAFQSVSVRRGSLRSSTQKRRKPYTCLSDEDRKRLP